jgi:hypothetical protein
VPGADLTFLQVASTWVETLDCLLDTYSEIGDVLPGLTQYSQLLDKHHFIRVHLENYYCAVLSFHLKSLHVFSRPSELSVVHLLRFLTLAAEWKVFFHASWKTFRSHFGSALRDLKKYRDLLSDEKITATIIEVQELRQSMEWKLGELSRQLQNLHLVDEDTAALRREEELFKKRCFVLEKLGAPDHVYDLEKASAERRGTQFGDWLISHPSFWEWSDPSTPVHRTLHIHGSPGTGWKPNFFIPR